MWNFEKFSTRFLVSSLKVIDSEGFLSFFKVLFEQLLKFLIPFLTPHVTQNYLLSFTNMTQGAYIMNYAISSDVQLVLDILHEHMEVLV